MEQLHCNTCGRAVQETVHTAATWKNDYYAKVRDGERIITCVDCLKKEKPS